MKRIWIALLLVLAMLAACLTACNTPVDQEKLEANSAAVFTLDVNPGVRIYVKEDNTVLAIEATNDDGEEIVAELTLEGENYEVAVEKIVDELYEQGYLEAESSSVLISVEKKQIEISERVNAKINAAFEKHGKIASVIEQELDELEEDMKKTIDEMAKKYDISKGKAHVIEKIREEMPELSEEELAELNMSDLGMMLNDTSDAVKEHFKRVGDAVEELYVGKQAALNTALASLEITLTDVTMQRVRITRDDGKMIYEVEFVYDGMEYEIEIDAESGAILDTESEVFEEVDIDGVLGDFCDRHNIDLGSLRDHLQGLYPFDKGEQEGEPLTKGEMLKMVLDALDIDEEDLKKTDVKVHEGENGVVCTVTVETTDGDVYRVIAEAFSGTVIRLELNGTEINIGVSE